LDIFNELSYKTKGKIKELINNNQLYEAKEAIHQYEQIVNNDIEIYSIKSVIYIMEGLYDHALQILLDGYEKDHNNFDIIYNLAYVYYQLQQYSKALHFYKRAIRLCEDMNLINNMRSIVNELKNKGYKQSIVLVTNTRSGCNANAMFQLMPNYITEKYHVHLVNYRPFSQYDEEIKNSDVFITTHGNFSINKAQIKIELWHGFPIKGVANIVNLHIKTDGIFHFILATLSV